MGGGRLERKYPPETGFGIPAGSEALPRDVLCVVGRAGVIHKQTDFDGWVARVTKPQLLEFIAFCYGEEVTEAVQKLIAFVNKLDETKEYGLVSECY